MKRTFATMAAAAVILISGSVLAGDKHPNLTHASEHLNLAFNDITAAQVANEYDMQGHAAKAKDLIAQAKEEIRQAREAANH
jgi:hypothetical protein